MQLSYWEHKSWLTNIEFTIVGSGIVGLSTAIFLKENHPNSKILVLERGILPQGASTKNAGFACFGSLSEIIADLNSHTENEIYELVKQRYEGIKLLRKLLGDSNIGYEQHGGHEIFPEKNLALFEECLQKKNNINQLLRPIFGKKPFAETVNIFGFDNIHSKYITHKFEGQVDTGAMMDSLLRKATKLGVKILNSVEVLEFSDTLTKVHVKTKDFEFSTTKLFLTTNGFASQFLGDLIKPARAQVLITKPINNLSIKGTFHFDEGYYYFRNIDNRILFGGGRNLDFKTEETVKFGQTKVVQNRLAELLQEVILPNTPFEVDLRWSGIMGVGKQKRPILKSISENIYCGVRMGGMGIAIGSSVGKTLANLV